MARWMPDGDFERFITLFLCRGFIYTTISAGYRRHCLLAPPFLEA